MALFGKKKAEKAEADKGKVVVAAPAVFHDVLLKPRITEKAGLASENNVYTFEVAKNATKGKVAFAIKEMYKVTPVKVNMINLPRKAVTVRGKKAFHSAVKKAIVYLKEGDKIEFV